MCGSVIGCPTTTVIGVWYGSGSAQRPSSGGLTGIAKACAAVETWLKQNSEDHRAFFDNVFRVLLQEVFGLADTPRVAGGRVAVLMHLLAPNMRPQQVTADLRSFWDTTYSEVRKELRQRYPKHAWPEDPWKAKAQRRPGRRRR